jgi:hypothetical protein
MFGNFLLFYLTRFPPCFLSFYLFYLFFPFHPLLLFTLAIFILASKGLVLFSFLSFHNLHFYSYIYPLIYFILFFIFELFGGIVSKIQIDPQPFHIYLFLLKTLSHILLNWFFLEVCYYDNDIEIIKIYEMIKD